VIDAHAFVGESLYGAGQSPEALLRLMDDCCIDQALLCAARPPEYHLQPANRRVAQAIKAHLDRFFGLARVDPWQKERALSDLREARESLGLSGLLLHPWEETFQASDPLLDPLVAHAADHHMPVFIETGYPWLAHVLDVAELARRHPQAVVIATHGAQLDASAYALVDIRVAMREQPNLLLETSGMYAAEFMEEIVSEYGAERLIFGSHTPWLDLHLEVERMRLLNVTEPQRTAITHDNIANLLRRASS
jgi:predicted TIM-barrel fold metal-dependent hydrolase